VTEVTKDGIGRFTISPSDFGLKERPITDIRVNNAVESAATVRGVLSGSGSQEARDLVSMNAAAALCIAGLAGDLSEGVAMAHQSIDSGSAAARLQSLVEETNR